MSSKAGKEWTAAKGARGPLAAQRWRVRARHVMYDSDWMSLQKVDVELPDGTLADGLHLVDYHHAAAGVVPHDGAGNLLLIRHYRFQTDSFGWEIPAGKIDERETPRQAARREIREEAGYVVGALKKLGRYHPSNGSSNQVFHIFAGEVVREEGAIQDTNEVISARWFSEAEVCRLIRKGQVQDGLSLTALLWYFFQFR